MLDKLAGVANRYEELCARCEQPDFYADPQKAAKLLREKNDLEPIITAYQDYMAAQKDMEEAQELMSDPEMKELCQQTFQEAKERQETLYRELQLLLLPKDPNDEKSVIMEIRGGVGGEESALFAHSLFRMYSMYAAQKGWSVELMTYNETELGGVKEADFVINGRGAYSRLKYESGVHRVQRRRRSAREQNQLRRPAHPQAHRYRGGLPGGAEPGAEPGKMYADAGLQTLRDGAGKEGVPDYRPAPFPGGYGNAERADSHLQLPPKPPDRPPDWPDPLQAG